MKNKKSLLLVLAAAALLAVLGVGMFASASIPFQDPQLLSAEALRKQTDELQTGKLLMLVGSVVFAGALLAEHMASRLRKHTHSSDGPGSSDEAPRPAQEETTADEQESTDMNVWTDSKDFLAEHAEITDLTKAWNDSDRARYSRVAGSLVAGALGDALGYTVEFDDWKRICRQFGDEGIRELSVGESGKAVVSDDTQMTLFTCEGMILGKKRSLSRGISAPVENYVHQAYRCWMRTQGEPMESLWDPVSMLVRVNELQFRRAPGMTCMGALSERVKGTIEEPINDSKGCGGVMRAAPLGYTRAWGDPMLSGARVAAITHGHPGGWIPAGVLSDIIAQILYKEPRPLRTIITEALDRAEKQWAGVRRSDETFALLRLAVDLAESDLPDREAMDKLSANPVRGGGWTGDEALAIAILCCLRYSDDLPACLRAAVNHSGDSDSTGAIAGNILGAYLGLERIPKDWLAKLELTEVLEAYAILMTDMDSVK